MQKPIIFVSCGQRTDGEKALATEICNLITQDGRFDPFFAQNQQTVLGLKENILDALASAAGFVTVMHARGKVSFGDQGTATLTRASVWIEQEIAIAAFIQQTSKRPLPTAAYIERGVGREGLRELLHLNPTEFSESATVLTDLRAKLTGWSASHVAVLPDRDEWGGVELQSIAQSVSGIGRIVDLSVVLFNRQLPRVREFSCSLEVPKPLLSFTATSYYAEVPSSRPEYRRFVFTETERRDLRLLRESSIHMLRLQISLAGIHVPLRDFVLTQRVYVRADLDEHSYSLEKTVETIYLDAGFDPPFS